MKLFVGVLVVLVCLFAVSVTALKNANGEEIPVPSEEVLDKMLKQKEEQRAKVIDPAKLSGEEEGLRNQQRLVSETFGHVSVENARKLSNLGRNLYLQERYGESLEISMEILTIYEKIHGGQATYEFDESTRMKREDYAKYDDVAIYSALVNVANVANKMQLTDECYISSMRALNIAQKIFGPESKEDLMQRSHMRRFSFEKEAMDPEEKGYTYSQYKKKWKELIQRRIKERDQASSLHARRRQEGEL